MRHNLPRHGLGGWPVSLWSFGGAAMIHLHIFMTMLWAHLTGRVLSIAIGLLSLAILAGCATLCWLSPSEKNDCIFHREVY